MKRKSFFVLLIFLSGLAFANEIENFRKQMRDIGIRLLRVKTKGK